MAGSTVAAEMPAVGKAKCGACHAVDKKVVGPAFMDVSAKYKGDKDAAGNSCEYYQGRLVWLETWSMPPKGMGANDADIKTMSEFIAGLAK